ncbi:MAG TPA: hypothetical protein VF730_00535 [Terracidiphilus sp.]
MKNVLAPVLGALGIILASPFGLRAQDAGIPPEVKAFAAQYVAAYNSKDEARLLSLNLPQSRACINPGNTDVYAEIARGMMRDSVPPHYLLSLTPVNEGNLKALANDGYFLVKPERELHIDYQYPDSNDGGLLILYLVRRDGRWMGDFPCMTEHAIKDFRDNAPLREHYKKLAAAIQQPLRSELLAMLRKHQSGEAAERYRKATGSDMKTSMLVINALQDQL